MFNEIPKVDFTVKDEQGTVLFRDAISFESISQLRNTTLAEREAMFQERYDNWRAIVDNPPQSEPIEEE